VVQGCEKCKRPPPGRSRLFTILVTGGQASHSKEIVKLRTNHGVYEYSQGLLKPTTVSIAKAKKTNDRVRGATRSPAL
jgi:hypothetical protein